MIPIIEHIFKAISKFSLDLLLKKAFSMVNHILFEQLHDIYDDLVKTCSSLMSKIPSPTATNVSSIAQTRTDK